MESHHPQKMIHLNENASYTVCTDSFIFCFKTASSILLFALSSHHCHAQMLFAADLVCFVYSLCEVDDIFSWWTLFSKEALEVIHELK